MFIPNRLFIRKIFNKMEGPLPNSHVVIDALLNNTLKDIPKRSLHRGGAYGKSGKTLLHLAAKYNCQNDVLHYIVNTLKVNPKKASKNKALPIHVSCKYGNLGPTKFLFSLYETCLDKCDINRETPLAIACKFGQKDLAEYLLGLGANLHCKNKNLWTPLHLASRKGNLALVELLIKLGANCKDLTKSQETCVHLAVQSGNVQTVNLLLPLVDHKIFSHFGTIFHVCKNDPVMIDFLLKNSDWNRFPKLPILLEICAPEEVIIENCKNELSLNSLYYIQMFDRADLIYGMYIKRILCISEIIRATVNDNYPKCKALMLYLKKWSHTSKLLFVKRYCEKNNCINRLPISLIRECVAFL